MLVVSQRGAPIGHIFLLLLPESASAVRAPSACPVLCPVCIPRVCAPNVCSECVCPESVPTSAPLQFGPDRAEVILSELGDLRRRQTMGHSEELLQGPRA